VIVWLKIRVQNGNPGYMNRHNMRWIRNRGLAVSGALLVSLAAGCRSPLPKTGAGDPALTIEVVMKNIKAYQGKRVRWYGYRLHYDVRKNQDGAYVASYVYADVKRQPLQPFAVEEQDPNAPDSPKEAWITGTIAGAHEPVLATGAADGSVSASSNEVPLLIYPVFENAKSASK
jgi:hypothetical protein